MKDIDPLDIELTVYRTGTYGDPDIHVIIAHTPSGNAVQVSGKGSEIELRNKAMRKLQAIVSLR